MLDANYQRKSNDEPTSPGKNNALIKKSEIKNYLNVLILT